MWNGKLLVSNYSTVFNDQSREDLDKYLISVLLLIIAQFPGTWKENDGRKEVQET